MLFSSMTFIFVFLPLVLLFYYILPKKVRNYELLLFSFLFYAWGEPKAFLIMLGIILLNYVFALLISRAHNGRRILLAVCIALNLLTLFYYKYFDFAISIFNKVAHKEIEKLHIILPIGISFFIFQAMSYTVDVFRKQCDVQKNPLKLALYVSLFPQLIAGPIVKYHDVADQIDSRSVDWELFADGIKRFIYGLSKKVLVANTVAFAAEMIFDKYEYVSCGILWLGAICYSLQIYYDFSGYSDMAIGLGKMFGFNFLENFNYPYLSSSITEFWRRWHISLSTWFKEYVYISLGGNRVSKARNVFNVFVVFLLTGIWHGAANVFILWGLWHGFFNIVEKLTGLNKKSENKVIEAVKHVYTLFVVILGWVMFNSVSVSSSVRYILNMLGLRNHMSIYGIEFFFSPTSITFMIIGIVLSMPVFRIVESKMKAIYDGNNCAVKNTVHVVEIAVLLGLFILCASSLAGSTFNPFIYFRF